jgi:hypothetical protein
VPTLQRGTNKAIADHYSSGAGGLKTAQQQQNYIILGLALFLGWILGRFYI